MVSLHVGGMDISDYARHLIRILDRCIRFNEDGRWMELIQQSIQGGIIVIKEPNTLMSAKT
jgi:hypothetical protein